jgi:hypothetical protein
MRHEITARVQNDDAQRKFIEALVTRHMRELFDRLPALAGFRLRNDLMVDDLAVFSWADTASRPLDEIVMRSLVELAERNPQVIELMRDRTFARSLQ